MLSVHRRRLRADVDTVGALLDGLSGASDPLWPDERWPAVRLDRGLTVGSSGGHGPIRYDVVAHQPRRAVLFRFRAPLGFDGHHGWLVEDGGNGTTLLQHTAWLRLRGPARLSWPLLYGPLHDALLRDALDKAERAVTGRPARSRWSLRVRLLRRLASRGRPPARVRR